MLRGHNDTPGVQKWQNPCSWITLIPWVHKSVKTHAHGSHRYLLAYCSRYPNTEENVLAKLTTLDDHEFMIRPIVQFQYVCIIISPVSSVTRYSYWKSLDEWVNLATLQCSVARLTASVWSWPLKREDVAMHALSKQLTVASYIFFLLLIFLQC